MTPEIEREYKRLIEEAEARFAAQVRWSTDGRFIIGWEDDNGGKYYPAAWEHRWLDRLYRLRQRELAERSAVLEPPKARHA